MTIETDAVALERALSSGLVIGGEDIKAFAAAREVFHVFFVYMRINSNGAFFAERYFHQGKAGAPISADTDPTVPGSLGWYAKDMATYARPQGQPRDGRYQYQGSGLSNFPFPRGYSYVVFFMDDVHWPFLEDAHGDPIVPFHDEKDGNRYSKHDFAFTKASKFRLAMTSASGVTTSREAIVMINRMRNANDQELGTNDKEEFCFDLIMRVRYADSTDGLTIIIDPTGENLGPPVVQP